MFHNPDCLVLLYVKLRRFISHIRNIVCDLQSFFIKTGSLNYFVGAILIHQHCRLHVWRFSNLLVNEVLLP